MTKINIDALYIVLLMALSMTIVFILAIVLVGIWWLLKIKNQKIVKTNKINKTEHFEGGAVLEGIVQSNNGVRILYNLRTVFDSKAEDDAVYSIRIPGVKPGDVIYFHCKSNVPVSQGAFFRAELRIGSMRKFHTGRDFQFVGTILQSDGSIRGDRYAGCGVGTDYKTLQYDMGFGYSRDACRNIAKNWNMPYYGLYNGGGCKVGSQQTVEINWEDRTYKDAYGKPYTRREPIQWETRQPFFYGNVPESQCSTQCIWDKPGEPCGTSNNMSVYAINENPTLIIANVAANSQFTSETRPIWVAGGSAGTYVATMTIPNFDILEFCPDINYEEFNATGCENGVDESSCSTTSLVNYKPLKTLCRKKYDWYDIGAFQYIMRKVFAYLRLIPLQRGYKIANTDISMYAFSGAKMNSIPCFQTGTDDTVCNPQYGQVKIDSYGGWVSNEKAIGYVTIRLPSITTIYGVVTQSVAFPMRKNAPTLTDRVLTYSVYYSTTIDDTDQSGWIKVDNKIFEGNDAVSSDSSLKKINFFDKPIDAIRIRISVESYLGSPAMRADIIVADDNPYQPETNIIRNVKEGNSTHIDLHDITNINSIRSIKNRMDTLNKGTGFANASTYIKQFMDANYEMIVLLKVIAEKIKYPIDPEQLTTDKLVLPDSPMYYNMIIKSMTYNLSEALTINFKRVFKNIFMYGRLISETPEIIRVCDCMGNPIDSTKQQCAPC